MPQSPDTTIVLTIEERQALHTLARAGRGRADLARRAQIILRLADGASYLDIQRGLGESSRTIGKWKRRFLEARVGRPRGAVSGQHADRLDAAARSANSGVDAQGPARWLDALEYPQTRQGLEAE